MNILIANVGGLRRVEVRELVAALKSRHKLTVAGMSQDSSFRGQAFNYENLPTRVHKSDAYESDHVVSYEFFSNPADAVSIMLGDIMRHNPPDLVVCGLSNGTHMGQDIYCSSNIGMAKESAMFGIPTIAIGTERVIGGQTIQSARSAIGFITGAIESLAKLKMPKHTFLNINIPTPSDFGKFEGVKITKQGRLTTLSSFTEKQDHNGQKYYWANFVPRENEEPEDIESDKTWYDRGYISITPINYDATNHARLEFWGTKTKEMSAEIFATTDESASGDKSVDVWDAVDIAGTVGGILS